MDDTLRKAREKFSIARCVILFLLLPPFTIWFGLALPQLIATLQEHGDRGKSIGTTLLGLIAISSLFSWPGYAVFLVLGLPTLYLLYRLRWKRVSIFMFVGATYAALPWLLIGLPQPFNRAAYQENIEATMPFFAIAGAISGALMWFLLFRYKISANQVGKTPRLSMLRQ